MKYQGSCHCGQVAFEVNGDLKEVVECNCSHCSRKGFLLWFVPLTDFRFTTEEPELTTYTFNQHVIKHQFCPTCGCAPFGFGTDPSGADIAAINARCLEDIDLSDLNRIPFDGRSK